nr:hypothetical protein [uncultured Acetatifactor sp.]
MAAVKEAVDVRLVSGHGLPQNQIGHIGGKNQGLACLGQSLQLFVRQACKRPVLLIHKEQFRLPGRHGGNDIYCEAHGLRGLFSVFGPADRLGNAVAQFLPVHKGVRGYPGTGQQINLPVLLLVDRIEIVSGRNGRGDAEVSLHALLLIGYVKMEI